MSSGLNKTFLMGNLTADPELRNTQGGTSVLNFRMATNERVKERDEWKDHTEFHNIVVWGARGEGLAKILTKGSAIVVEGNIRTREWEKDGVKRWTTEIHAREVCLAGGARAEGGGRRDDRDDRDRDRYDDRDRDRDRDQRDDRRGRESERGRGRYDDRDRGRRDDRRGSDDFR